MARGKADRQLTVGKKLEIIEEADRTGLMAVTAQKYGVKTGQIRDWKKNIDRLRATDPSRLVCASNVQRGHLVFNETYAQYWVGYNKFCSANTNYSELKDALRTTQKDVLREGVNGFGFPAVVDPTATHPLEVPSMESEFFPPGDDNPFTIQKKDMEAIRVQLREFFDNKPFPTKYMYYVTRFDFFKPDPNDNSEEEEGGQTATSTVSAAATDGSDATMATGVPAAVDAAAAASSTPATADSTPSIDNYISFYVAICGNGSVMVPMAVFPPVEDWHWERKKPVKLRHAHSVHRTKREDPTEALQFFSVTWKKFYDEEAKYSDKFAFLLDKNIPEFHAAEFTDGLKTLEGHGKCWDTFYTERNPLDSSNFDSVLSDFVLHEWRAILAMKKSSQPNDYRKCVAFWFYSAWELFAGDNARAAFRSCNMYLEDKATCSSGLDDRIV